MYLGALAVGRDNNYNLLRLAAALGVIVSHGFALVLGGPEFEPWRSTLGVTPGTLAVYVFFVASGFLVSRSLDARRSGSEFVAARTLRIFPGLVVNLLLVATVIGPMFSTLPSLQYFADPKVLVFVWRNLQMFALPYPEAVLPGAIIANWSLWSLPVEICCYVILLAGWLAFGHARRWVSILALGVAGAAAWRYAQTGGFSLGWLFASGAVFYVFRDRIQLRVSWAFGALALLVISAIDGRAFQVAVLLAGPYLVFCAAYLPTGKIRRFNRLGDYSYGTYIYGFPMQLVALSIIPSGTVWQHVLLATGLTLPLAVLSWHWVESPVLKLVPRLRRGLQRRFAVR